MNILYDNIISLLNRFEDNLDEEETVIDALFDNFDAAFIRGEFDIVDNAIDGLTRIDADPEFLILILSITLPAKRHLKSRVNLFIKTKAKLSERLENNPKLLDGL